MSKEEEESKSNISSENEEKENEKSGSESSREENLSYKENEEVESNKNKLSQNSSSKKSKSEKSDVLNYKDNEEVESNKNKLSQNSSGKKSKSEKSDVINYKDNEEVESNKNNLSQNSSGKKSKSEKSDMLNYEDKENKLSQHTKSQKSQNLENEDKENKLSQHTKSQKSQNLENENKSEKSKLSIKNKNDNISLPKITDNKNNNEVSQNINKENKPLFDDILKSDTNDENLNNLPPISYNNKYIKSPSQSSKGSKKSNQLNNENKDEKKSELSKKSQSKKSNNENNENEDEKKSELSKKSQSKKSSLLNENEKKSELSKKSQSKKSNDLNNDNGEDKKSELSQKSQSKKSNDLNNENEGDKKSDLSKKSQSKKSSLLNEEDKKSELSQKSQSKKSNNLNNENEGDKKSELSKKSHSKKSSLLNEEDKKSELSQKSQSKKSSLLNENEKNSEFSKKSQSKKSSLLNENEKNSEFSKKSQSKKSNNLEDKNSESKKLSLGSEKSKQSLSKKSNQKIEDVNSINSINSKKLKKQNEGFPIDVKDNILMNQKDNNDLPINNNLTNIQNELLNIYKSQKQKIINEEIKYKEPPHPNSINLIRLKLEENEKEKINDLLCYSCQNYPLNPITCSECKTIFCKECIEGNNKCPSCNSIFKEGEISEENKNLYSSIKIFCKYKYCGCQEILSKDELINHENNCKNNIGKCPTCGNEFNYEELYSHINNCNNNERKCNLCGYKDTYEEYNKTDKKIEHIKHILFPEIHSIIKSEMNKFYQSLFEDKENQKKKMESSETKQANIMKSQEERISNMETLLSKISENIENIQASPAHNAVGLRVQNIELANKLKSIKLIKNIPKVIDNGYECDNKFCVIKTFKNENIIAYPNSKYGINAYNLATNEDKIIIKKAHESNIHCLSYCQNEKTQKTLLITCSFDTNMNVYCIEDNWKLVKNFINAHNDYSIFSLDSLYNEENGIIAISGNRNLEEVKIWFCEKSEKNKEIKVNSQVFCIKHNPKNVDEIFIGTNEGILQYNISKISDNDNKPEKSFIDNEIEKKSNHLCICFLDNNEYNLIEGDEIGKIRIWALNTGNLINKFERGILKYSINTLEKWDDRFIFGGSRDGKIILFDVIDCVQVNEIGSHNGYVYCVKITDHFQFGKIIVSCGFDGDLKIWGSSE